MCASILPTRYTEGNAMHTSIVCTNADRQCYQLCNLKNNRKGVVNGSGVTLKETDIAPSKLVVSISPCKSLNLYQLETFLPIAEKLRKEGPQYPRMIIYCRRFHDCFIHLHTRVKGYRVG